MDILLNFTHLAPEAREGLGHCAAHALVAQRVRGLQRLQQGQGPASAPLKG